MSYIRGDFYIYIGEDGVNIYDNHGRHVVLPEEIFDELVVMRYAELTKNNVVEIEKRAVSKHFGNVGCDILAQKYGYPSFEEMIKKIIRSMHGKE